MLQAGYRLGDFSLIYPLARGAGPLLAVVVSVVFLGERPTGLAIVGAMLIAVGIIIFTMQASENNNADHLRSVMFALLTGACIAGYTLWDKQAVSRVHVPPLILEWFSDLTRTVLLSPLALRQQPSVKWEWQNHRPEVIGVAVLIPLSYILVLIALVFSPVSYIAPAREISIVIGAAMGARILNEKNTTRRFYAAGLVVLGVVAIAFG